jgi:hypothetical protein
MQMLRPRAVDRQASSSAASAGARPTFIHQYSNEKDKNKDKNIIFCVLLYAAEELSLSLALRL